MAAERAIDLLAAAAEDEPLLLVVDDAHWLDEASAEAVAFVAQRLSADGIGLLVASEGEDDLKPHAHRALGLTPPPPERRLRVVRPASWDHIHRRDRLGGLIHEYAVAA